MAAQFGPLESNQSACVAADRRGRRTRIAVGKLWARWYIEAIDSPYRSGVSNRLRHVVELRRVESYAVYSVGQEGLDPRAASKETIGVVVGRV